MLPFPILSAFHGLRTYFKRVDFLTTVSFSFMRREKVPVCTYILQKHLHNNITFQIEFSDAITNYAIKCEAFKRKFIFSQTVAKQSDFTTLFLALILGNCI